MAAKNPNCTWFIPAMSATAVLCIQPRTMKPPVQITTATLAIATNASDGDWPAGGGW